MSKIDFFIFYFVLFIITKHDTKTIIFFLNTTIKHNFIYVFSSISSVNVIELGLLSSNKYARFQFLSKMELS
jgi:hypothetical protein